MKAYHIKLASLLILTLFVAVVRGQQLVRSGSGNVYTYTFNPANNTCASGGDKYFFLWANAYGIFSKTNQNCGGSYITSLLSPFTTCFSVDKYGDDPDEGVITNAGSGNLNTNMYNESYAYSSNEQNLLGNNDFLSITTVHDNSTFQIGEEMYLVLSVAGSDTLQAVDYIVSLNYNANQLSYISALNDNIGSGHPTGSNYFSFANLQQNTGGNLKWDIPAAVLNGKEKNIYVALKLSSTLQPGTPLTNLNASVKAVKADGSSVNLESQALNYTAGAAYDPNIITVSKERSDICGTKDEWFDYTIHFQNIGSAAASTVEINLDLDDALDPSSLRVSNARIGAESSYEINQIRSGAAKANFSWWNTADDRNIQSASCRNYVDCNGDSRIDAPQKRDICFYFNDINLQGLADPNLVNIAATEGEITFSVKTKYQYASLRSYAGIVFNCNEEIVTNLAVTTCSEASAGPDDKDCTKCAEELKKCRKANYSKMRWYGWLGWIIAVILLLFILFRKSRPQDVN